MHIILFNTIAMGSNTENRMIRCALIRFNKDIREWVIGILQIPLKRPEVAPMKIKIIGTGAYPADLGAIVPTINFEL